VRAARRPVVPLTRLTWQIRASCERGAHSLVQRCLVLGLDHEEGAADRADHVFDFTDADTLQHVRLAERLSLSGVVTRSGEPMTSATLWLTRPTGESVGTARTDASGITCSRFRRPAGTS